MKDGRPKCPGNKSTGKICMTRLEASRAARGLNERTGGERAEVYRCPDCRKWHVARRLPRSSS